MSHNNNIKGLLFLKDENIEFNENCYCMKKYKRVDTHFIYGKLSYEVSKCSNCGCVKENNNIIKWGFKTSSIKMARISNLPAILILKKQRYFCKECNSTFTCKTTIVEKNCHISKNIKLKILLDLKEIGSLKSISKTNDVSVNTVIRILESTVTKTNYKYLPEHICIDEFKSVRNVEANMSFVFCNALNSEIIDIVTDRRLFNLKRYFNKYPKKVRKKVKSVVCDMYSPYIVLIKEMFPEAKIVIDKFHVVQNFSRAFNITRVQIMKELEKDSNDYHILKKYWKLLLKGSYKLNFEKFKRYTYFKSWQSEDTAVNYMINIDKGLKENYNILQSILTAINTNKFEIFKNIIEENIDNSLLSEKMQTAINTANEYLEYISNMMDSKLTNGRIEGNINKIKLIKRVSFGYRFFYHLRARIMLSFNHDLKSLGIAA